MNQSKLQEKQIIYDHSSKQITYMLDGDTEVIRKVFYNNTYSDVYCALVENHHMNVCRIYSVNQEDGFLAVEEEYLGKMTLADMLPIRNKKMLFDIVMQLCNGLEFLHNHNIVHRDLKPENIYFVYGRVVINDFDISRISKPIQSHGKDTTLLGSVGYASPEQYGFSRSDQRSDIYSLGVVINELVCGKLITDELASGQMKPIVLKCTEMNRDDRYQTVAEVRQDLKKNKNWLSRYALPGFRTGNRKKRLWAVFGYSFLILLVSVVETEGGTTFYDHLQTKMIVVSLIAPVFLVLTNYLNVLDLIPRPLKRYRIVGACFVWGALTVFMLVGTLLLNIIMSSLLAAYQ